MRSSMHTAIFVMSALALAVRIPAQGSGPCRAPTVQTLKLHPLPVQSGNYELNLIATEGPKKGARATGYLSLWPTAVDDQSPATGQRAVQTDTLRQPLYGAVQLDFDRVAAPVVSGQPHTPDPTSRDPVYPGVLVLVD